MDPSKQEESFTLDRVYINQSARPAKDGVLVSNGRRIEQGRNDHNSIASPHRKESTSNQSKIRQTKKSLNGTAVCVDPGGKLDESRDIAIEAVAMNARKNSVPTKNPLSNKSQSDAKQPRDPQARTPKRQFSNIRPPPGLLAPPGFSGQPDLEGISSHSSPSSLHQYLSSPVIQFTPAWLDVSSTPPPSTDFLGFLGSEHEPLENPLFRLPLHDNSPRPHFDNEVAVPPLRSHTFTPPIIEPSPTAESDGDAPDVQALLGAGSNFNVSNFLNGILSESTQFQQSPSRQIIQKQDEVAESDPLAAIAVGVSLDPWNNSDHSNVNPLEDILQGVMNQPNSPIIVGVPLQCDSSSHLNFANAEYYSELAYARNVSDEGEDNDSLEPDSFYNQLLGED